MKNTKYAVNDNEMAMVNGGGWGYIKHNSFKKAKEYEERKANEAARKAAGVGGAEGNF